MQSLRWEGNKEIVEVIPVADEMPKTLHALLAQLDAEGITDYRRYREVRRFMNFKARETNTPISGSFELTPLCNLDCKMCYVHLNKDQMNGAQLLPTEAWKDIMKQAVEAGMMYARVTGGECLTYLGFKELYCYLRDMGVEVTILSNGILMDSGMVEFLKENRPAGVQITLYGASEDAYERVTGHREFERVIANIRRLRSVGIPVTVAVTPNAYMTDSLEVVQLLHDEGICFNINPGLMEPREETGRNRADADLDTYVDMMKLRRKLSGKVVEPVCDPEDLPDPITEGTPVRGVRCGAGRNAFAIDWRGQMCPCNTFPCEAVDVLKLSFDTAWKQINQIALNFLRPAECEDCHYNPICKHCIAEHAVGNEIGHANPAVCRWGRRMVYEGLAVL